MCDHEKVPIFHGFSDWILYQTKHLLAPQLPIDGDDPGNSFSTLSIQDFKFRASGLNMADLEPRKVERRKWNP